MKETMPDENSQQRVSAIGRIVLGVYLAAVTLGLCCFIAKVWTTATAPAETRLILLVLAMGALGGCVHAATSFVAYVGNDKFYKTWVWYYVLRIPISAALALITYFVVRGGFFAPAADGATAQVNDFGIAAVSGLVGMFSKQATAKLDEVFSALFRTEVHAELGDKLADK